MTYAEETKILLMSGSPVTQLRAALAAAEELVASGAEWAKAGIRFPNGQPTERHYELAARIRGCAEAVGNAEPQWQIIAPPTPAPAPPPPPPAQRLRLVN